MAGIHKIAHINPTIDNLCVRTLPSYGNFLLPYSIEMVWLNEDGGKIHASVKKAFVSRFINLLEEGISYQIRYFGVDSIRTTHHEYVVNLNQRTDVHQESSSIHNMDLNVVGYLAGIGNKKTLEKDGKFTKYTVIELEIDDEKIMECALFDNYAHELNDFLGSGNRDGAVVVLQFIVLQNFMYGTKMFFNLEDATVIQFKNRFEKSRGNINRIPNEAAFLKIYQGKTIEQLKELDTGYFKTTRLPESSSIPRYGFKFVSFGTLNTHGYDCTYLVDVVGYLAGIGNEKTLEKDGKSTKYTDVNYTGGLLPISKTSSIIEGEKVEGAKNLLLEFSNEVAVNDESELLENAITPTKRLSSESEESKVEGDTSTSKKIKIEKET
ncbi:hypothetical protein Ahy_B07g087719 [Arachis hypogaea]|uniref:Replication protein A 70 kDa DNA-binding subunit B/D first OB fold domain-containing protein n=1 Tax=Arachis hypogaea TaxID=3818 RepID=A0A444YCT3_ARAHY|nr:hypothetical protein Ahy_B07g087719 [Arachis hypogaea]